MVTDEERSSGGRAGGDARVDVDAETQRDGDGGDDAPGVAAIGPRYELGEAIGRGGMGEVVAARDRQLGREVAVKRLRGALSTLDAATIARFTREARVQGRLDHPAIAPVHELGTDAEGRPFFVMKRLRGRTLAEVLAARRRGAEAEAPPLHALLAAFASVCQAAHFAHERGVIHRDLKPANIVLGDFGEVWVIDWGIAKLSGEPDDAASPSRRVRTQGDAALTDDDSVLGTPGYMPPEQLHGAPLDGRADVYALGCILFELLAREPLHPVGRAVAVESTLAGVDARPSARRPDLDVPPELDAICVRATARAADDRFASARALHDALDRYLAGDRDLERRRALAADHLAAARGALAAADAAVAADVVDARRRALREAGRALALDPADRAAAALVTRLLVEPPAVAPAEVERDLAAARDRRARSLVQLILTTYLSYVLFAPLILWMGIRRWEPVVVFGAVWGAASATAWWFGRRGVPRWGPWALMAASASMIVMVGQIFGVLVVAPVIAVSGAAVMCLHPFAPARAGVVAVYAAAAIGPLALEQLGAIAPTFAFLGDHVVVTSRAMAWPQAASAVTLALMVLAGLVLVGRLTGRTRALLDADERNRAMAAWQLAQLAGGTAPPGPRA